MLKRCKIAGKQRFLIDIVTNIFKHHATLSFAGVAAVQVVQIRHSIFFAFFLFSIDFHVHISFDVLSRLRPTLFCYMALGRYSTATPCPVVSLMGLGFGTSGRAIHPMNL